MEVSIFFHWTNNGEWRVSVDPIAAQTYFDPLFNETGLIFQSRFTAHPSVSIRRTNDVDEVVRIVCIDAIIFQSEAAIVPFSYRSDELSYVTQMPKKERKNKK